MEVPIHLKFNKGNANRDYRIQKGTNRPYFRIVKPCWIINVIMLKENVTFKSKKIALTLFD